MIFKNKIYNKIKNLFRAIKAKKIQIMKMKNL
jgi:hypothetical protein